MLCFFVVFVFLIRCKEIVIALKISFIYLYIYISDMNSSGQHVFLSSPSHLPLKETTICFLLVRVSLRLIKSAAEKPLVFYMAIDMALPKSGKCQHCPHTANGLPFLFPCLNYPMSFSALVHIVHLQFKRLPICKMWEFFSFLSFCCRFLY